MFSRKFLFTVNLLLKIGVSLAIVSVALSLKTLNAIAVLVVVLLILLLTSRFRLETCLRERFAKAVIVTSQDPQVAKALKAKIIRF